MQGDLQPRHNGFWRGSIGSHRATSRVILLALAIGGLSGCASKSPPPPPGPPPEIVARPGDAIRVSFSREQELNGEFRLNEAGVVLLPLIGERDLSNVTADEARRSIAADYDGVIQNQSVQVEYLMRVRVLGSVRSPGLYYVDQTMELGDAIALAGGPASDGKLDDIRVIRHGDEIRTDLEVTDPVSTEVRSGDQIMVTQRSWLSRNGAAVLAATIAAMGVIIAATR